MEPVRIAGRMEHFKDTRSNTIAIVDYAHNYASVTALLDYVDQRYGSEKPEITLITGSAGNKAYDRRAEIVHAAQDRIDHLVLTFEDTDDEPVEQVCADMNDSVTNPQLDVKTILDRAEAVETTVSHDRQGSQASAHHPHHRQRQRTLVQRPRQAHPLRGRRPHRGTRVPSQITTKVKAL